MEVFKKVLAVVFLACFSISSIRAEFTCEGKPDGVHPNPDDCASFFKCSNGNPSLFPCPKPLLFNPDILVCDWAHNVDCQVTQAPPTEPPEEGFTCKKKPNGLYSNPKSCRNFFKCSNGFTYLYDCPSNLLFDPDRLICDYPENVPSCRGTTLETSVAPSTTTPAPPTTDNPVTDAPVTDAPTSEGPAEPSTEGPGEPTTETPVEPTTENPAEPSTGEPEKPSTQEQTQAPTNSPTKPPVDYNCTGKPDGLYRNEVDCHTFFMCSNGYPYLMECPEDLVFDPEREICDYQENVPACGGSRPTTEAPSPSSTTEDSGEFSCKGKPCGNYPSPNCTTFWKCTDGSAELRECPVPLVFNPSLELCDLLQNVPSCNLTPEPTTQEPETPQPPTPEPETPEPPTPEPETPEPPTPEPETPEPETPEPGTPEPPTPEPETPEPPTPEPETPEPPTPEPEPTTPKDGSGEFDCDGRPDGIHPNPKNCSTFFKCSGGLAYLYDCPDDTKFHKDWLVCTFPEQAVCASN